MNKIVMFMLSSHRNMSDICHAVFSVVHGRHGWSIFFKIYMVHNFGTFF